MSLDLAGNPGKVEHWSGEKVGKWYRYAYRVDGAGNSRRGPIIGQRRGVKRSVRLEIRVVWIKGDTGIRLVPLVLIIWVLTSITVLARTTRPAASSSCRPGTSTL